MIESEFLSEIKPEERKSLAILRGSIVILSSAIILRFIRITIIIIIFIMRLFEKILFIEKFFPLL